MSPDSTAKSVSCFDQNNLFSTFPPLLTLNPLFPTRNTFNHCSCNLKPDIKFTTLSVYFHPNTIRLEDFVFPKCLSPTLDITPLRCPSGSQWCSNLSIYMNDIARVKRQWLLCILWSAMECKLMTLDGITTQIERHYELTTNITPLTPEADTIFLCTFSGRTVKNEAS